MEILTVHLLSLKFVIVFFSKNLLTHADVLNTTSHQYLKKFNNKWIVSFFLKSIFRCISIAFLDRSNFELCTLYAVLHLQIMIELESKNLEYQKISLKKKKKNIEI